MSYDDVPPVDVTRLEDGSVQIRVGDQVGTVSSGHLLEPKANQLKEAWIRAHRGQ